MHAKAESSKIEEYAVWSTANEPRLPEAALSAGGSVAAIGQNARIEKWPKNVELSGTTGQGYPDNAIRSTIRNSRELTVVEKCISCKSVNPPFKNGKSGLKKHGKQKLAAR